MREATDGRGTRPLRLRATEVTRAVRSDGAGWRAGAGAGDHGGGSGGDEEDGVADGASGGADRSGGGSSDDEEVADARRRGRRGVHSGRARVPRINGVVAAAGAVGVAERQESGQAHAKAAGGGGAMRAGRGRGNGKGGRASDGARCAQGRGMFCCGVVVVDAGGGHGGVG